MTEIEQDHIVDAFTFELGKVDVQAVVDRMLQRLVQVDGGLATRVGLGLGIAVDGVPDNDHEDESPALSMVTENVYPPDGRVVHVLAADGADLAGVAALKDAIFLAGAACHLIAPHKGTITNAAGEEATVDRSFHTASSAEADAVVVAGGTTFADDPIVATYLQSAFRHFKTVGGGSIINYSSYAGAYGMPMMCAYSAAKGGVLGYSRAVAREWGAHNVRVNVVMPCVHTELGQYWMSEMDAQRSAQVAAWFASTVSLGGRDYFPDDFPWAKTGPVEYAAFMNVFLASDKGAWIHGQTIGVDGGMFMGR
jgi:NAD(P)-dependent dehydrogenase (short-subunit alcohol dehydrogenase family)